MRRLLVPADHSCSGVILPALLVLVPLVLALLPSWLVVAGPGWRWPWPCLCVWTALRVRAVALCMWVLEPVLGEGEGLPEGLQLLGLLAGLQLVLLLPLLA